uniref:DUF19 domain-containing protein n=1 Tax=Heterorhabditis bacteriophora TaxID=37862 RepID=A0A1I7WYE3_HETBA
MLALILLVLAGSTLGNYNYQSCNLLVLNNCQQQFNKQLKINESLGVKTYQDLRKAIETTLGTEKAYGLANICAAFNDFKQCVGNSDTYYYESCVGNPLGLLIDTNGCINESEFLKTRYFSYLNSAIECYKDVFRKKCPKFYEVIWFGCNYERIGAQINFPQCTQSFCTLNMKIVLIIKIST